jgi:predicted RNase H-like nuclease
MKQSLCEGSVFVAMTSWVAGVDGCRAGWIAMLMEVQSRKVPAYHVRLCAHFAEVLSLSPKPVVIAVDIPIGLLDEPQPGGRECDRQARRLLGPRTSSVFSPPARTILEATRYEHVHSHGVSIQAFGILPKIREVDRLMTPELQRRVYEAHPELAFTSFTGVPMQYNKKTHEGREERLRVLEQAPHGGFHGLRHIFADALKTYTRSQVAPDDLLDACILACVAVRISNGQAARLPPHPPLDTRGLRMEIWY